MYLHEMLDINEIVEMAINYNFKDCRTWPYYIVSVPTLKGKGPVHYSECDDVSYEVWDSLLQTHSSHELLPDAINEALRLTNKLWDHLANYERN